jgi:PAS domain-containing protein
VTHGVAMFDGNHQLVVWNGRLRDMLSLPDAQLERGRSLEGLIRFLGERGDYGNADAVETVVREHLSGLDAPFVAERMLPDGRILEFSRYPLPNGGLVVTYTDLTDRRHTEYLLADSTREMRAMLEKRRSRWR